MDDLDRLFGPRPSPHDRYVYEFAPVRTIDGDTIVADIDLGFEAILHNQAIRLLGIQCVERSERVAWDKARNRVIELLAGGETFLIRTIYDKRGSFKRILAIVWIDGICLNRRLVEEGHAVLWGI